MSNNVFYTRKYFQEQLRTDLILAAYIYEFEPENVFMDDDTFDYLCSLVDLSYAGDDELSTWWKENFKPNTGSWVQTYPLLDKLKQKAAVYDAVNTTTSVSSRL